jgi:hypothetical protein
MRGTAAGVGPINARPAHWSSRTPSRLRGISSLLDTGCFSAAPPMRIARTSVHRLCPASEAEPMSGNLVTREELAAIMGVHTATIEEWVRQGMPVAEPGDDLPAPKRARNAKPKAAVVSKVNGAEPRL